MAGIVLTEPEIGKFYVSRGQPSTYLYVSNIANGIVTFNNVSISNDNRFDISVNHPTISLDDFKKNYKLDVSDMVVMGGQTKAPQQKKQKQTKTRSKIISPSSINQRFMYYLVIIHKLSKIVISYFLFYFFHL